MKIAFVAIKEPHMCFGQVGLEVMATLLKQNAHKVIGLTDSTFDPSNYITNDEKRNLNELRDFQPDIIGFSVLSHRYQWCVKFAGLIKKEFPHTKIVFGGVHVTAVPEVVIREKCVDMICLGEGEEAFLELVNEPSEDIKNIWFKNKNGNIIRNEIRPLIQNLDSLPFTDKSIWINVSKSEFKRYLIMVSRGCPYSCSFCFSSTFHQIYKGQNIVRFRSVDNVISELKKAKEEFNIEWVLPMDDNLTLKSDWFNEFAYKYQKYIGLPYVCTTHPLTIDEERARLLKKSGCRFIKLGLQSGCERVRRKYLERFETNEQLLDAITACKKNHLNFTIDHIFGIEDSIHTLKESAKLYNEARPFEINTFQLYVFPATPIIQHLNLSLNDEEKINRGIFQKSTIRSQERTNYSAYRNLFIFSPLLPKNVVETFLRNDRLMNLFYNIPELFIWVVKIINSLRGGNTLSVFTHVRFLPHKIKERLRGYQGEFD